MADNSPLQAIGTQAVPALLRNSTEKPGLGSIDTQNIGMLLHKVLEVSKGLTVTLGMTENSPLVSSENQ